MAQQIEQNLPSFSWQEIDMVFLDLDGTVLDKYFDDYFWEEFVPEIFARKNSVAMTDARQTLLSTYRQVENSLAWTDLDYWSAELDLDIPMLKREVKQLIGLLPQAIEFLDFLRGKGKDVYLVTNAHPKTLSIKFEQVDIAGHFTSIFCSKDMGAAKEQQEFWHKLAQQLPFDKNKTLFIDDTEQVLLSARKFGLRHLLHIAKPNSKREAVFSRDFPSISGFSALLPKSNN